MKQKKSPKKSEIALFEKLDKAICGLTGMAVMAKDPPALGKYNDLACEVLEALKQKWNIE